MDSCTIDECGSGVCGTRTWCAFDTTGAITDTPLRGGGGGTLYEDRCPDGQVVMGYRGRAGTWNTRIQAVCGELTLTGDGPYAVSVTEASTTPERGLLGG
ncbi:MAG: hypothetical protein GWN79_23570, partial [Actinobacteria bacterium]|nr:hypothetical protein [Actinomycetota bacterium]NIS35608.1 hypothetical protein [Actinomycetota bacterium]NIT98217.1 hypothetical protein [Actinomycetota bacterium]NIU21847.1 hypothetical protein [Actinomycetota bacterium]NIU70263.1 hypothetical protein [Actinomycetota bacterium]